MSDPQRDVGQHPLGTLVIVGLYGVIFAIGWLVVYLFIYLSRGAITP